MNGYEEKMADYSNMANVLAQELRTHFKVDKVFDMLALNINHDFVESDMIGVVLTDTEWALYETLGFDRIKTFRHINDGTWDAYYIDDKKVLGEDIWNNEIRKTDDDIRFTKYIDFEKVVDDKIASGELLENIEYGYIFKVWEKEGE